MNPIRPELYGVLPVNPGSLAAGIFIAMLPPLWYNNPKTYKEGLSMSRADEIFQQNCRDILENGVWDTDQNVRPHWEDGTPAHTVKKFGIINRYDLRQEFPILTIRRTYFKTCIDELLWIWQQKSNNIHDLRGHIWTAGPTKTAPSARPTAISWG